MSTNLDDRIFRLQRHKHLLPDELQEKLRQADVAYLQDRDATARVLVSEIHLELERRGIQIPELPEL